MVSSNNPAAKCFASLLLADEELCTLTSALPGASDDLKVYIAAIRRHIADAMSTVQNLAYAEMAAAAEQAVDRGGGGRIGPEEQAGAELVP